MAIYRSDKLKRFSTEFRRIWFRDSRRRPVEADRVWRWNGSKWELIHGGQPVDPPIRHDEQSAGTLSFTGDAWNLDNTSTENLAAGTLAFFGEPWEISGAQAFHPGTQIRVEGIPWAIQELHSFMNTAGVLAFTGQPWNIIPEILGRLVVKRGAMSARLGLRDTLDLDDLVSGGITPYSYTIVTFVPGLFFLASDGRTLQWTPGGGLAENDVRTAAILVSDSSSPTRLSVLIYVDCTVLPEPPPVTTITGPSTISVPLDTGTIPSTDYSIVNGTAPFTTSLTAVSTGVTASLTGSGRTRALSGSVPSDAVAGDEYNVTLNVSDSSSPAESDQLDVTLRVVDTIPDPTASCPDFSFPPGGSDDQQIVITDDPGGTKTYAINAADSRFTVEVSSTGLATAGAPATVPRNTSSVVSGTVTFENGFVAPWSSNANIPCLPYSARGGSASLEPGTSRKVSLSDFGGCPGVTTEWSRKSGDTDPSFATFVLDDNNDVEITAASTATPGQKHTAKYIATPSSGLPVEVDVTATIVPRNPDVTAPDITVPPNRTRTGQGSVRNPGGTGTWSISNEARKPDWITSIVVNSTGLVSVSRGAGGQGETWDYVLQWTPDDTSIPPDEDIGTITAGNDPITIGGENFEGFRGEPATNSHNVAGGSGTYRSVALTIYGDHTGVTLTAAISGGNVAVRATSTSAASFDTDYEYGLVVEDSTGAESTVHRFTYRIKCPAVSVTGNRYEGQDAGTDVEVEWDIAGDCDATGTVALVGSYPFEVTAPVKSGRKITATVSIPADTVAGTELQKIVARYTSTTESDNTDTGECTIVVGNPVEFNLPDRFETQDYGGVINRQVNAYVSGIRLYSVSFDGTAPAGVTLSGNTNFARGQQATYVLGATNITGDTTVNLRIRDSNGVTVARDSVVIGIRDLGCTIANNYVGVALSGFMGVYFHGRTSESQFRSGSAPLALHIPSDSPSASLVRVAPHLETQYDAGLVALKLSLDDLGVRQEFTANIVAGSDTSTVLGTCSGWYQSVPIFELSTVRASVKRGSTVIIVLTSFPPTSDPRIVAGSLRISLTVNGGEAPPWIKATQHPSGSPVSISISPPAGLDPQSLNIDIGVEADFMIDGAPVTIPFRFETPGATGAETQEKARVTIGVLETEPSTLQCHSVSLTASEDHSINLPVVRRLGSFNFLVGCPGYTLDVLRIISTPFSWDGDRLVCTLPTAAVIATWNAVTIQQIAAIMERGGVPLASLDFRILAQDSLSELSCSGRILFVRQE